MDNIPAHNGLPLQDTISNPQVLPSENQPQTDTISPTNPQIASQNVDNNCDYCVNKEKYQNLIDTYVTRTAAKTGDKIAIPFIEELALTLDITLEDINTWLSDPSHVEFIASIKKLYLIQRLRLLQKASGRFQPEGAIFLLRKLHHL